jgi:hypothetical protein
MDCCSRRARDSARRPLGAVAGCSHLLLTSAGNAGTASGIPCLLTTKGDLICDRPNARRDRRHGRWEACPMGVAVGREHVENVSDRGAGLSSSRYSSTAMPTSVSSPSRQTNRSVTTAWPTASPGPRGRYANTFALYRSDTQPTGSNRVEGRVTRRPCQ